MGTKPGTTNESAPAAGSTPAAQNEAPGLTLELPVLNTAQVKASSPEAVGQLQAEGKAQADSNLAALEAAFPGEAAFVLECQKKGLDVNQAKAAKFDAVQAELAQTKLKVTELETKVAAATPASPNVSFAAGDNNPDGASSTPAAAGKLSDDQVQQEAGKIWQKHAHLATEFDTIGDFYAYYKRNPGEDYSKRR